MASKTLAAIGIQMTVNTPAITRNVRTTLNCKCFSGPDDVPLVSPERFEEAQDLWWRGTSLQAVLL